MAYLLPPEGKGCGFESRLVLEFQSQENLIIIEVMVIREQGISLQLDSF